MSSFSDRMGITNPIKPIQLNGIDKPLLNRLWNIYLLNIIEEIPLPKANNIVLHSYVIPLA